MERLNSDVNPYPAKLVSYSEDKVNGVTIIYSIDYIRGEPDKGGLKAIPDPPDISRSGVNALGLAEITLSFKGPVATILYIYKSTKTGQIPTYEMRAFTSETPIYKHPDFPLMFAWYGAGIYRGRVEWAHLDPGEAKVVKMTLPSGKSKRVFTTCPDPKSDNANPMRGIQDFWEGMVEISETYEYASRASIPKDVVERVGSVQMPVFLISRPAGDNPSLDLLWAAGLNAYSFSKWIRSGGKVVSAGSGYRVTRMWLLSMKTDWVREVHTHKKTTNRVAEEDIA
jgi:hypothetical protein